MNILLTKTTLAISELKKDPMCAADKAEMCILNRNKPAFYTVCPERMTKLLEIESDYLDNQKADQRKNQKRISVNAGDL